MAGDSRTVNVKFVGDASSLSKTLGQVESETGKSGSIMQGVWQGVGQAATHMVEDAGEKVLDFLGDSINVAEDDEVAHTKLANSLKNVHEALDPDAIETYVSAQEKLGFTSEETQTSLSTLIPVTGSLASAQAAQGAAEELARQHGLDLATATKDIIGAEEGRTQGLKILGVQLPKNATQEQILAAVMENSKGAAESYASTMKGGMAVASAEVEDAQAKLGTVMIGIAATVLPGLVSILETGVDWFGNLLKAIQPVISTIEQGVMPVVSALVSLLAGNVVPIIQMLGEHMDILAPILAGVGVVLASIIIPAIIAWATAQWAAVPPLVATAVAAVAAYAPFIALGAVVAGVILILEKLGILGSIIDLIMSVAKTALPALGAAFSVVGGIIGAVMRTAGAVIGAIIGAIRGYFTNLIAGARTMASIFSGIWSAVTGAVQTAAGVMGSVLSGLGRIVSGVFGAIAGAVRTAINGVIGIVNGVIRAIDNIQVHIHVGPVNLDWNGLGIRQIPRLHSGGIVPGPAGADVLSVLQAGEMVVPRGGQAAGPTIIINIPHDSYIDAPAVDRLTNQIVNRLRYAPGT